MSIFKDLKKELMLREEQDASEAIVTDLMDESEIEEDIVLGEDAMNIPEYDEANDTYNYNEGIESLLSEEEEEPVVPEEVPVGTEDAESEAKTCGDDNIEECGIDEGIADDLFEEDGDIDLDLDDDDTDSESALLNYLEGVDPTDGEVIEDDDEDYYDDEDEDFDDFDLDLEDGELSIQADDLDDDPVPDDCPTNTANQASKEGAVTDEDLTDESADFELFAEDGDVADDESDDEEDEKEEKKDDKKEKKDD